MLVAGLTDPISVSRNRFDEIHSYRTTIVSRSGVGEEIVHYYFRKPGFVRMELELPYPGSVVTYDPEAKEVRVRPFGFLKQFVLSLSPDNMFLRSASGHRVDESDLGSLLRDVMQLRENGQVVLQGSERVLDYEAIKVEVRGEGVISTPHGVHVYVVWIDQATFLPVRVRAYDIEHDLIEDVTMHDLVVDVDFGEGFFEL